MNKVYKTSAFMQKLTEKFPLEADIKSLTSDGEVLYAAGDDGLFKLCDGEWFACGEKMPFTCVYSGEEGVFAVSGDTVYSVSKDEIKEFQTFDKKVTAMGGDTKTYLLLEDALYKFENGGFVYEQETEFNCFCLDEKKGKVCIANSRSVQRLEGKRKSWRCIFPEHSTMPEIKVNAIAFDNIGYLWVGADEGLYIYDYKSGWYSHKQISALPEEKVFSITFTKDGDAFVGTDAGAVLISMGGAKYLPAKRYALDTDVTAVYEKDGVLYTATKNGVVKISFKEMTLEEKADFFFEQTEKYFPRKEGFVTSIVNVVDGDVEKSGPSRITDNDGLWTQTYLSALCMCYAVTKNKKVLAAARRCKDAMLLLTRAPGIKGFTARAVRYPDEKDWGKGLETQGIGEEWHRSPDGTYEWLGETSSDEMTGHYMGFSLYYDLCADDKEKEAIKEAVCAITDHILDNDGYLMDWDSKPTTWACWNEHQLNNDSMWMWEKGVNSLEMLNFLKISHHMSGDERYLKKYMELIEEHHFLINAAYHKRADGHMCHIDDNLAMSNTLAFLRLEKDPAIRNYILMGLKHHFDYERVEGNPYFNFVYGAFTSQPCDVDASVKVLEDYPLDLLQPEMINSKRRNLEYDDEPIRWGGQPRLAKPFAWDERPYSNLGLQAFKIDGQDNTVATTGLSYLFPYWIGRYFGVIE